MLVYPRSERYAKFSGTLLAHDPYLLAVSYNHPLYKRISALSREGFEGVEVDKLANESFVFVRYDDDFLETPYELCVGRAMIPHVRVFTNSQDMHRQVIAEGQVVGFVAKGSAE